MVRVYGELGKSASRVTLRHRPGERVNYERTYYVRHGHSALMTSQTADGYTPREPCLGILGGDLRRYLVIAILAQEQYWAENVPESPVSLSGYCNAHYKRDDHRACGRAPDSLRSEGDSIGPV